MDTMGLSTARQLGDSCRMDSSQSRVRKVRLVLLEYLSCIFNFASIVNSMIFTLSIYMIFVCAVFTCGTIVAFVATYNASYGVAARDLFRRVINF